MFPLGDSRGRLCARIGLTLSIQYAPLVQIRERRQGDTANNAGGARYAGLDVVDSTVAFFKPNDRLDHPCEIRRHKLFAPPVYPGGVRRNLILDRVLLDDSPSVTVLQGPAGHGKSTTLQQIKAAYEALGWRTAWLTLDDADNDPRRFEAHFGELLTSLASPGGRDAPAASQSSDEPRDLADAILDRLGHMGAPVAIMLDEFQTLANDGILRFFRSLLARLPAHVRVFIGSRTPPEIGLATLLVNRKATVLRTEDLRFTPGEATLFFAESKDLRVSAQEVGAIYRRTEGWPGGLQLFRLALGSPDVRKSLSHTSPQDPSPIEIDHPGPHELTEYLTDNVLTLQTPRVQEFLLKTSLLRRLSAPLCTAVTGFEDAQDILVRLERSGLFVSALDSRNQWFKYHGMFASVLTDSLRRTSPRAACEVHRQAALWHHLNQMPEECLHHAVACSDFELAATALTDWSARLVSSARLITLEHWFDRLPFEHVAPRLTLVIRVAYALMFLQRGTKLRPLLELMAPHAGRGDVASTTAPDLCRAMCFVIAEDNLPAALAIIDRPGLLQQAVDGIPDFAAFSAFELGAAANVLAYGKVADGDFDGARKTLMLARAHVDRGAGSFVSGYALANAASALILQGDLQQAIDQLRAASAQEAPLDISVAAAARAAIHIWALYEANDLAALEPLRARFQREIFESVAPHFMAASHLSIARMHDLQGHPAEALQVLDELERIGRDSRWERLSAAVDWERVRRALIAGDVDRACALAARIAPMDRTANPRRIYLSEDVEGEAYGRIRLAIACGDHAQATQRIAHERDRQPRRVLQQIKLGVLDAVLQHQKGSPLGAQRSLRTALRLARNGRYVRCVLDEGDTVVQLLRREYEHLLHTNMSLATPESERARGAPERSYIEQLLTACGVDIGSRRLQGQVVEPLSGREQEILRHLANGASNKALACQLFVSENTVKFHLKNIYGKLGVSGRLQAINAARAGRLVS